MPQSQQDRQTDSRPELKPGWVLLGRSPRSLGTVEVPKGEMRDVRRNPPDEASTETWD